MQVVIGPMEIGKTTGVKTIFNSRGFEKDFALADLLSPATAEWIIEQLQIAKTKPGEVLLVLDEI